MKKLFVFALAAVAALVACNPDPEADPNETKDVPSCPALQLPSSIVNIIVPKGSVSSYKSEEGWEKYSSKISGE